MLTLASDTEAAFSSGALEPVILVEFTVSGTAYRFTNTSNHSLTSVNSACLSSISTVSSTIDPITRKFTRSNYVLTFAADSYLRSVIKDNFFRNINCDIKLGAPGIAEANYIVLEKCLTQDYYIDQASVVIDAVSAYYSLLSDATYTDAIVDKHPLEVMTDIFTLAQIPTSYYTASTFSPDSYTDIEHWNVSRFDLESYFDPWSLAHADGAGQGVPTGELLGWASVNQQPRSESAAKSIDELAEIMTGQVRPNASGVYEFSRLDIDGSSVRTLTVDDVSDLRQLTGADDAYSTVRIRMGAENNGTMADFGFINTVSESGFNNFTDATGDTGRTLIIENPWIYPIGKLVGTGSTIWLNSADTTMKVNSAGSTGFCGLAFSDNGDTAQTGSDFSTRIPADRVLNSTRYAYLLIVGENGRRYSSTSTEESITGLIADEIVRVDAAEFFGDTGNTSLSGADLFVPHGGDSATAYPQPWQSIKFTFDTSAPNSGRAQFSSTTPNYWMQGALVYDVTIAVDMLQSRAERAAFGIPKIECTLSMRHVDLQPGDVVQLVHDQILAYGIDGSDLGVYWEVLKTELSFGNSPGVRVTLGYLRGRNTGVTIVPPNYEVSSDGAPDSGPSGNDDPLTQLDYQIITDAAGATLYAG